MHFGFMDVVLLLSSHIHKSSVYLLGLVMCLMRITLFLPYILILGNIILQ